MRVQSLGPEDHLEEGMATHSSFLPRKFHGQRSLLGYGPWGLHEVGRNRAHTHVLCIQDNLRSLDH